MSVSFPYFPISGYLGVPYSEVLAIVEHIEKWGPFDPVIIDPLLYAMIENAVLNEQARRKKVTEGV